MISLFKGNTSTDSAVFGRYQLSGFKIDHELGGKAYGTRLDIVVNHVPVDFDNPAGNAGQLSRAIKTIGRGIECHCQKEHQYRNKGSMVEHFLNLYGCLWSEEVTCQPVDLQI